MVFNFKMIENRPVDLKEVLQDFSSLLITPNKISFMTSYLLRLSIVIPCYNGTVLIKEIILKSKY
jgi:hypothetical protein